MAVDHLWGNVLRDKINDGRVPNDENASAGNGVKVICLAPSGKCSVDNPCNSRRSKLRLQNAQETKPVILDEVGNPIVFGAG
ncbi:UNVERIFIED_CONTAM: hypothetical protein Sradi_4506600 [Sesamum radiatum]|uniref:Uncharacterized protein n=1 Tax=Sesamum radiatum TaxID=300843 RepID=A0AAW2N9U3_SESRA